MMPGSVSHALLDHAPCRSVFQRATTMMAFFLAVGLR